MKSLSGFQNTSLTVALGVVGHRVDFQGHVKEVNLKLVCCKCW